METYSEIISRELNELLKKMYDAEKGYKSAAENISHKGLKSFFDKKSIQRYEFGHQIKKEIKQFGEIPESGGSIAGDFHRIWINLRTAISTHNTDAILDEVIRGEKATIEQYNKVISDTALPTSTKALLEKQKNIISLDLETTKNLEELQ